MDRARKKTEQIADNEDMSTKEKNLTMKSVYKRAGLLGKKKVETKYVVSKKGQRGKQSKSQGPVKLVDKRLKKDMKASFNKRNQKGNKKAGNKNGKPTMQKPGKKGKKGGKK